MCSFLYYLSKRQVFKTSLLLLGLLLSVSAAHAQGTAFTYQGRLTDGGAPANNNYDLQFTLWDAAVGGTQQPQPAPAALTKTNVAVTGGVFSVLLDFGVSAFPGADRFLEVGVRPGGSSGTFTILSPRQQISSTPYALRTLNATAADSLSSACVGCVQDAQINAVAANKLTGTIPPSSLPAGSFIQNTITPQANANFNISGNAIIGGNVGVGANSPSTKLDVRGNLTLDPSGSPVLYTSSGGGEQNRFLQLINSPTTPSASGLKAGGILVADSFAFANPAKNDLIVKGNVGIGFSTPSYPMELRSRSGSYGFVHSTPDVFVPGRGVLPGVRVGSLAGTGPSGAGGGWLGTLSNDPLHFFVNGGGPSMTVNPIGNVGIGTINPQTKFQVVTNGIPALSVKDTGHVSVGQTLELGCGPGCGVNALLQIRATGGDNGVIAESSNIAVIASGDKGVSGTGTRIGVGGVSTSGTGVNGTSTSGIGVYGESPSGYAGFFTGKVRVTLIPPSNNTHSGHVCFNPQGDLLNCDQSSLRLKTSVHPFLGGLDIVRRLRPINFTWKANGLPDVGLGAEDVARVAPAFTYTNSKGGVEGVRYERLNILLINAVKEQQQQLEQQQQEIARLQGQVRQLRGAVHRRRVKR